MEKKKVYVVVGAYMNNGCFGSILSKYAVKSNFEDAVKELDYIKLEIEEECKDEERDIPEFKKWETGLKATFLNDDEEIYEIKEVIVDYEGE